MSWLELDDRILDHPKFVRAVKAGGSEAIHLWLGMRAYCGQLLTDGIIPADMIDEVRGPRDPEKRATALAALITFGLLEPCDDGGVQMHDYLHWSTSRDIVLDRRQSWRDRKRVSRGIPHGVPVVSTRDTPLDTTGTPRSVPDPRARTPLPSDPIPSGSGSDLDPISVGESESVGARAPQTRAPAYSNGDASLLRWTPGTWLRRFGAAWAAHYQQLAYGQPGDSKACGSLGDTLAALPASEVLVAQEKAPGMFAEFLGSADPRLISRRHPFAFFVQEWGGLRVPKLAVATPPKFEPIAVKVERERSERITEAREERVLGTITPKEPRKTPQEHAKELFERDRLEREAKA